MKKENIPTETTVVTEQSPLLTVPTEEEVKKVRINDALKFFNLLYLNSSDERYSYLWLKKDEKEKLTVSFQVGNEELHRTIAEAAIRYSDEGWDVYCGLCTTDTSLGEHERAKSDNVTGKTAVWCDIDIQGGKHQGDKYPPNFNTAKDFLPLTPSLSVNSGYGRHDYWLFNEVQPITDENRAEATQLNKDFLSIIRSNAGKYGKAVDPVHDLARVLRVPGTLNYKLGKDDAKPVFIAEVNDIRYSISDLRSMVDKFLAEIPAHEEKESKPPVLLNDLDSNLLEQLRDDEVIDLIRNSKQGERFSKLFDEGDTSAYNDDDSSADMALMSMLPFWTAGNAAQMERIFNRSALALRDKWNEREDYRQMTINNALALWNGEFYKAGYHEESALIL